MMSKHSPLYSHEFGLNALLFDVLVCETGKTLSATRRTELTCVTRALWAVESEMARDNRQALLDFNKLLLAASDNKLFVGPQVAGAAAYLNSLLYPARCCSGSVYVALCLISTSGEAACLLSTCGTWPIASGVRCECRVPDRVGRKVTRT